MGTSYYTAPNPPFGATFTYYLKEKSQTRREKRKEAEKKAIEAGDAPRIPTLDELRAEDEEKEPAIILTVRDGDGAVVARVTGPRDKGIHRVSWNLRYPSSDPAELKAGDEQPDWAPDSVGHLVAPGTYSVTLEREVDGAVTQLAGPESFEVVPLNLATFAAADKNAALAFQRKVNRLNRAVQGASRAAGEVQTRIAHLRRALLDTPAADPAMLAELRELEMRLNRIVTELRGDETRAKREEAAPPSISERVSNVLYGQWFVTSAPTKTQQDDYRYAADAFGKVLAELRTLATADLAAFEARMEAAGAPWTPGRIPEWTDE